MIAITGATGQLGRLVVSELLRRVDSNALIALVRDPSKARDLADLGITVRQADYNKPETLTAALEGVDQLLMISSSEVGQRAPQHRAVIKAAQFAGVKLLAYTSVLNAEDSSLGLAVEHRDTEQALRESGLNYVLLRNGWYNENYVANLESALEHGAIRGSTGEGRISSAARADYALAAAVVLTTDGHTGRTYELAGDESYSLTELAQEVANQSGKAVAYVDLPEQEYQAALVSVGLPEEFAGLIASSDAAAAKGALFDQSRQLSRLIGRPTTPIAKSVSIALGG